MKLSIFMILIFEIMWLGYQEDTLKVVGMVFMSNVLGKNISKHFKLNLFL